MDKFNVSDSFVPESFESGPLDSPEYVAVTIFPLLLSFFFKKKIKGNSDFLMGYMPYPLPPSELKTQQQSSIFTNFQFQQSAQPHKTLYGRVVSEE